MFVFFRRPGSNRKAVLQNNDLITAELSESNAHTPMLLRHWFGLSSCANNFRLVVFPMFRSRGALQTVIDSIYGLAPFQVQTMLDSVPFW